jgi:hypothetical protein
VVREDDSSFRNDERSRYEIGLDLVCRVRKPVRPASARTINTDELLNLVGDGEVKHQSETRP